MKVSIYQFTYRTLNCMVGQMKQILAAEQKKTDFKPEDENNVFIQYTSVSFISGIIKKKFHSK